MEPHYKEVEYITKYSYDKVILLVQAHCISFSLFLPWYNEKPNISADFHGPTVLDIMRFHCSSFSKIQWFPGFYTNVQHKQGPVSQRFAINRMIDINHSSMAYRVLRKLAINRKPLWNGAQKSVFQYFCQHSRWCKVKVIAKFWQCCVAGWRFMQCWVILWHSEATLTIPIWIDKYSIIQCSRRDILLVEENWI